MTAVSVGVVDVYAIDPSSTPWRVLVLQRGAETKRPGSWEAIHGSIDAGELPEAAALRELGEETGLNAQRLYNITVHAFYLHVKHTVELCVVFCVFVDSTQQVRLSEEHAAYEWLDPEAARLRYTWPRAKQVLDAIEQLLKGGDAGTVEDVLRVH